MTPLNENFDSFEFRSSYELMRFMIYLGIVGATGVINYIVYLNGRSIGNKTDPFFIFNKRLKNFGFTGLDVGVLSVLPFLNIASNVGYLISFKMIVHKLNKISLLISSINVELNQLLGNSLFKSLEDKTCPTGLKSYLPQLYAFAIPVTASSMITISFSIIAFRDDTVDFSTLQKVLFFVALWIFCNCWIYPPTAISADFLVCFLLNNVRVVCEKYHAAILFRKTSDASNIFRYVSYKDKRNIKA